MELDHVPVVEIRVDLRIGRHQAGGRDYCWYTGRRPEGGKAPLVAVGGVVAPLSIGEMEDPGFEAGVSACMNLAADDQDTNSNDHEE